MTAGPTFKRTGRAPPSTLYRVDNGSCGWCGEPILEGQRKRPASATWHHECLGEYYLTKDLAVQREHLFWRSLGHCEACGLEVARCDVRRQITAWEDSGIHDRRRDGISADGPVSWVRFDWRKEFQADHVIPLWSLPKLLTREQVRHFWGPENLQALCLDCHGEKTKREAAERAQLRRRNLSEAQPG